MLKINEEIKQEIIIFFYLLFYFENFDNP